MSLDRRTTLQAIAVGGLVAGTAGPARAARPQPALSVVIYDGRYPLCRTFAQEMAGPNVLLVDSRARDLGVAWREEVAAHLRAHPGRVEGLSLYADRFISGEMGRDSGLRALQDVQVPAVPESRPGLFRWSLA